MQLFLICFVASDAVEGAVGGQFVLWLGAIILAGVVALLLRVPRRVRAGRLRRLAARFADATSRLRSDALDLRTEAIRDLGRIAKGSAEYHWKAMEALADLVREATRRRSGEPLPRARSVLGSDVEIALTVLGTQRWLDWERERGHRLTLADVDLAGAALVDAHFECADLHAVRLEQAELWRAHLDGADLSGAHLAGANLAQAHLEHANLDGADLTGVDLQSGSLRGASLRGANLTGARLTLAHLEGADLREVVGLTRARLREAYRDEATVLPGYVGDPQ